MSAAAPGLKAQIRVEVAQVAWESVTPPFDLVCILKIKAGDGCQQRQAEPPPTAGAQKTSAIQRRDFTRCKSLAARSFHA